MMGRFGGVTVRFHMLVPLLDWVGLVGLLSWVMAEVLRGGGVAARAERHSTQDLLHAPFARGEIGAGEYERALEVLSHDNRS